MLKININSDKEMDLDASILNNLESSIQRRLARFDGRVAQISVRLSDQNGPKSGKDEVRCMIEARPEGIESIHISHDANSVDEAVSHAIHKMGRSLDEAFAKQAHKKGKGSSAYLKS